MRRIRSKDMTFQTLMHFLSFFPFLTVLSHIEKRVLNQGSLADAERI